MAFSVDHNPIQGVKNASSSGAYSSVPCPSVYKYVLEDVSESDAGRTEDGNMWKKMIGQVTSIELAWNGITTAELHNILNLFKDEYVKIKCIEPMTGSASSDYMIEDIFYIGNRSAPMYSAVLGLWENVSFKIIRRSGGPL